MASEAGEKAHHAGGQAGRDGEEEGDVTDGSHADEEEEEEEEEEEDEPQLKYATLTKSLGPVYRNGDATSAFIVAGDKMVCCAFCAVLQCCGDGPYLGESIC